MTRRQLIQALTQRAGIEVPVARCALLALFGDAGGDGLIAAALERGERVNLVGFGVFSVRLRAARRVRDPRSGDFRELPAMRTVVFRPGVALKDRLRREI